MTDVDFLKTGTYNLNERTNFQPDYSTGNLQWIQIQDSNSSNAYPFGQISYNNSSVSQMSSTTMFMPQEAMLYVPITTTMTIGNTAGEYEFGYEDGKIASSNVCALAKKSSLAFFERTQETIGGINIGFGSNQRHYHEILKSFEVTDDQKRFVYENYCDHYFPEKNQRMFEENEGEVDNLGRDVNTAGVFSTFQRNNMFFEQGKKFCNFQPHLIGTEDVNPLTRLNVTSSNMTPNTVRQLIPHFENSSSKLVWFDILQVPLSKVTTALGRLPTCSNLNGLGLTFQLPFCQNGVSMEIVYKGNAVAANQKDKKYDVESVNFTAGSATNCPYIIADCWNASNAPFTLFQKADNKNCTIKISSVIGWGNKLSGSSTFIRMPIINVSKNMGEIARNPKARVDCLDCVIDSNTFQNITGGTVFSQKVIAMPHSKVRRVFLLPMLAGSSNGAKTKLNAEMSPFSMSPVWPSCLSLDNINIFIGGQAVYSQPITMKSQLYEIFHKGCASQINGNSLNSIYNSGQLKYSDYLKTPIYMFNLLDYYTDEETDTLPKQIAFSFTADYKPSVSANIIIVFEKEVGFAFDRISGLVTNL